MSKILFKDLIQAELYMTSITQKNFEIPFGRPDIMYFVQGIYGGHNCGHRVDQEGRTLWIT
jgi:hypothetical protein